MSLISNAPFKMFHDYAGHIRNKNEKKRQKSTRVSLFLLHFCYAFVFPLFRIYLFMTMIIWKCNINIDNSALSVDLTVMKRNRGEILKRTVKREIYIYPRGKKRTWKHCNWFDS